MKSKLSPFFWSGVTMVLGLALTLYAASFQKVLVEEGVIPPSPDVQTVPVAVYFFGVVAVMAVILFLIPVNKLKLMFRLLFTFTYSWGAFVIVGLIWPTRGIYGIPFGAAGAAVVAGTAWLLVARVWVHDLLLLITLSAAGSVFGFFFARPWVFIAFMLIVAVYDFLAVRFKFMTWMAGKLSESTTLPAFIFPRDSRDWGANTRDVSFSELAETESAKREFSILGGGDIGFPLMLAVSVFFDVGPREPGNLAGALLVGGFAVVGLMSAFVIQMVWMKGKPVPALPPIAVFSIAGFLLSRVVLA
jgi:presenilin-like A22 family membrane protease